MDSQFPPVEPLLFDEREQERLRAWDRAREATLDLILRSFGVPKELLEAPGDGEPASHP